MSKIDNVVGSTAGKETNNYTQGRGADATTPKRMGPAVGNTSGNPPKGGGINRATVASPHQTGKGPYGG
jgi:hypothetical protein